MSKRSLFKRVRAQRIETANRRQIEPLIDAGNAQGEIVAPTVDAVYGATRPAKICVVDRCGGTEGAKLLPEFETAHGDDMADLHRRGPKMVTARIERKETGDNQEVAARNAKSEAGKLPVELRHHRFGAMSMTIARWGFLFLLGVADIGLSRSVLELFGLDPVTCWMLSGVIGIAQLMSFHTLGELVAGRHRSSEGTLPQGRLARNSRSLELFVLALPLVLLALFMALTRADFLELQIAKAMGLTSSGVGVGYGLAFATFATLQLVLDVAAFMLGRIFGAPDVKAISSARGAARGAARRRWAACRRTDRCEARFGAAYASALARCDSYIATVWTVWDERRTQAAAVSAGIGAKADPPTAARMSEVDQLTAIDEEARGWRDGTIAKLEQRRADLVSLAAFYDFGPAQQAVDSQPTEGNRPAESRQGNHKGDARNVAARSRKPRGA